MKIEITWTYDKVTPESAEHGDTAEHGFYMPGGWEFPIGGCECDSPLDPEDARCSDTYDTARDAVEAIRNTIGACELQLDEYGDGTHKLTIMSRESRHDRDYFERGIETHIAAHIEADPRLLRAMARELQP